MASPEYDGAAFARRGLRNELAVAVHADDNALAEYVKQAPEVD